MPIVNDQWEPPREREVHEAFEELCGGPDRAFRLMYIHQDAVQIVSGDRYRLFPPKRTAESVFRKKAAREGYTPEQIQAFLDLP